jgi:hypothetical protein
MRERFSELGEERNVGIERLSSVVTDVVMGALDRRFTNRRWPLLAEAATKQQKKEADDNG